MKKGSSKPTDALQSEAKRMEAKLEELRNFMTVEKEKRKAEPAKKEGPRWRSGTTKFGNTKYAEIVIGHQPKPKPPAEPKPESRGS